MKKIKLNPLFLSIICTNFFLLSCNNEDISKIVSCMHVISQKNKNQTPDQNTYSTMLLKCFITITEEQGKEILVSIEQDMKVIEPEEIEKLTDINSLKEIPPDELKKYSLKLEKAIKDLKKMQEKHLSKSKDKTQDYDYEDDEEFKKTHPSRGNSLGSVMKKLKGLLKAINNMGNIVIAIIFLYFGSIMLRKCCDNKKSKVKNKDKDKNKSKDKKKNE